MGDNGSVSPSMTDFVMGGDVTREYESDYSEPGEGAPDLEDDAPAKPRRRKHRQRAETAHVIQKHGWGKLS